MATTMMSGIEDLIKNKKLYTVTKEVLKEVSSNMRYSVHIRRRCTFELNARAGKHKTNSPKAFASKKLNWLLHNLTGMKNRVALGQDTISEIVIDTKPKDYDLYTDLFSELKVAYRTIEKAIATIKEINLKKVQGESE